MRAVQADVHDDLARDGYRPRAHEAGHRRPSSAVVAHRQARPAAARTRARSRTAQEVEAAVGGVRQQGRPAPASAKRSWLSKEKGAPHVWNLDRNAHDRGVAEQRKRLVNRGRGRSLIMVSKMDQTRMVVLEWRINSRWESVRRGQSQAPPERICPLSALGPVASQLQ